MSEYSDSPDPGLMITLNNLFTFHTVKSRIHHICHMQLHLIHEDPVVVKKPIQAL